MGVVTCSYSLFSLTKQARRWRYVYISMFSRWICLNVNFVWVHFDRVMRNCSHFRGSTKRLRSYKSKETTLRHWNVWSEDLC